VLKQTVQIDLQINLYISRNYSSFTPDDFSQTDWYKNGDGTPHGRVAASHSVMPEVMAKTRTLFCREKTPALKFTCAVSAANRESN